MQFNRSTIQRGLSAVALVGAGAANAAAPDFTSLSGAVDFTTVGTAILAIAAVIMLPKVIKWGANKVLSMVRG